MPLIDSSWYTRPPGIRPRTSAGGVIVRQSETGPFIALVREADFPHFVLPKGGVEAGETLEQAARREIEEEAGLRELQLVRKLGECERLDFAKTRWITAHYFLFTTTQVDGVPTDNRHHYAVWWFPLDALPLMLWPEQVALIEANRETIRRAVEFS